MQYDTVSLPESTASLIDSWETVRCELLSTRVCDLGLRVQGSPVEPFVNRLYRELELRRLRFKPKVYLTDSWGCPDEVPLIGIPFYLADERLSRLEHEQTGEIEDAATTMAFLRHEAGHALNYAYRLWESPGWSSVFGRFSQPYRERFTANPFSRDFVRHLSLSEYRWTYAQKHPDEDFAETCAVWLTPGSDWRRKYRRWPALRKLRYVAELMRQISGEAPVRVSGPAVNPVASLTVLLADHYGRRVEAYRVAAHGYVDDKLREIFPPVSRDTPQTEARTLLQKHGRDLMARVSRWSGLEPTDIALILRKIEARADALHLGFAGARTGAKLLDVTALATALAMDFRYLGRFSG